MTETQCPYRLARTPLVDDARLVFTEAHPGQCNCPAATQVIGHQRDWLTRLDALDGSTWSAHEVGMYLAAVYEEPSLTVEQVDVTQISFFWSSVPVFEHDATIPVWWACLHCNFETNVVWAPYQDAVLDPCTTPVAQPFPGFFVQRQMTVDQQLVGILDHHWVEVMRIARIDDKPDEADLSTRGQVWFWLATGSGIWWNVGHSMRYLGNGGSSVAIRRTCADARRMGYDSLQISDWWPGMALELVDCRGALLADAGETWQRACPPDHVQLLAGIAPAPRFAPGLRRVANWSRLSRPCTCRPGTPSLECLPTDPPPPSPSAPLLEPFLPPPTGPPPALAQAQMPLPRMGGSEQMAIVASLLVAAFAIALLACRLLCKPRTVATSQHAGTEMQHYNRTRRRNAFGRLEDDEVAASEKQDGSSGEQTSQQQPVGRLLALCLSVSTGVASAAAVVLLTVLLSTPPPQPPLAPPPRVPAPPMLPPELPPPSPSHPRSEFVGGCRSPWPRASYGARAACNQTTACTLCGSTTSCAEVKLPSGMRFPRHNVPQYSGNAVWDGNSLTLAIAVKAMLGDPFAFAVSPEFDAVRHVFQGHGHDEMMLSLQHRWRDEPRYPAYEMSRGSRNGFFGAISHLNGRYMTNHRQWTTIVPPEYRQHVDDLITRPSVHPAAATCAAAIIMDGIFANKTTRDLWVTSLFAAGGESRNAEADPSTLLRELYAIDAGGNAVEVDPSSEIYTTPYQTNANAFFGGNLTYVFRSTDDAGSGIDILFHANRMCPGPPPRGATDASWHAQWCQARDQGVLEFARSNGDAGEMRTPHYKAPDEVDGVLLYPWGRSPSPWNSGNSFDFDLSVLSRPVQWAFYRASSELVLVLCPAAVASGVFGILRHSLTRFVATKPPPETLGGSRADEPIAPRVPYATLDIAHAQQPEVAVPVWGVLFRCTLSNMQDTSILPTAPEDAQRVCVAAEALTPHIPPQPDAVLETAVLPNDVVQELHAARPWPSTASVDLSASADVASVGPPDSICVLSVTAARNVATLCGDV